MKFRLRSSVLLIGSAIFVVTGNSPLANALGITDIQQIVPESSAVSSLNTTRLSDVVVDGLLRLRADGPAAFPDVYGGVASGVEGDEDVLVVYLTHLDPAITDSVLNFSGVPGSKVTFEQAVMSRVEAERLDARFTADAPALQAEGYELRAWGIARDVSYEVQLAPSQPVSEAQFDPRANTLAERYGTTLRVTVSDVDTTLLARHNDNAQWYGGDFLTSTRTSPTRYQYCTSAFPLKNAHGNKFVLTAGHCFSTGERIFNGIPPGYRIGGWNSNLIGTLYTRTYNTGYPDAGLIAADGARGVWNGPSALPKAGNTVTTVDVLTSPWPGMPLCVSGAYEGEVCGLTVGNPDRHHCIGSAPCFPHQADVIGSNYQTVGNGDSGAPLYATISGTTYGVGIVSSAVTYGDACVSWTDFGRACGPSMVIQNIGPILTQWGLSLDP